MNRQVGWIRIGALSNRLIEFKSFHRNFRVYFWRYPFLYIRLLQRWERILHIYRFSIANFCKWFKISLRGPWKCFIEFSLYTFHPSEHLNWMQFSWVNHISTYNLKVKFYREYVNNIMLWDSNSFIIWNILFYNFT